MEDIKHILDKFNFKGELAECEVFGSGHINTTYMAVYNNGDTVNKYIVQRVN
ncbi:MAG TPA: mucin desulfatase, partial [Ruminococcaceae bacterium]|nr:mucin desulfatase [Oscillospiraceae bacterium]